MRHHDALLEPVDLRPRIRYTRVQLKTGILFFSTTSWRVSFERYTEMGRRIRPFDRPDCIMLRLAYGQPLVGQPATDCIYAHLARVDAFLPSN